MGRSVSTHPDAVATVYLHPEFEEGDDSAWESFIEDLRDNVLGERYPSFCQCNRWVGRENHVIAGNERAEISVSEYCGTVAVCLAPLRPENPLDAGWCARVAPTFERYLEKMFSSCAMVSQGHGSNGEQFFTLVGQPGSVVTSKEGRLF